MEEPKTHLMDPFTGKAACREYSDSDYIEKEIPEFVDCKKCIDWYYYDYLKLKENNNAYA